MPSQSLPPSSDLDRSSRVSAVPGFVEFAKSPREQPPKHRPKRATLWVVIPLGLLLTLLELLLPPEVWLSRGITAIQIGLLPAWAVLVWKSAKAPRTSKRAKPGRFRGWPHGLVVGLTLIQGASLAAQVILLTGEDWTRASEAYRSFAVVRTLGFLAGTLIRARPLERFVTAVVDHPARLMAVSFALTALVGAFLLMLPSAVTDVAHISFVDALFTSTSAVCVTGLAVNNISQAYTVFGQGVILALVQVGGLGIMVLYSFFVVLSGSRMSVKSSRIMAEMIEVESLASLRRVLLGIVFFTLAAEALGATALYYALEPYPDVGHGPEANRPMSGAYSPLWAAVFSSVSAYCNAGFSLFRDGMVPFSGDWLVCLPIMTLVAVGGIGYPVCFELLSRFGRWIRGKRLERMSLHTKTSLWTSLGLLIVGILLYLVLEWNLTMAGLPLDEKVLTAAFQSVITRTAGFNTLDYSKMATATWFGTCILMFIGASPGSTGGGIKTTTFAVLLATFRSELVGGTRAVLGDRAIPATASRRALSVTFLSVIAVAAISFALMITEQADPLRLFFETVSAFATVGLSTGITPDLTVLGKLLIIFTMFLGRVGPLTLAVALAQQRMVVRMDVPEERIGIG